MYFHNFNMRPNFFFPFQSNYIPMVKLKIEASVQNHYKNKIGREDWILFQRWRLGILKITFCPSMFTYFSSVKSRLTLNYLMHAWLEIENAYREARGLYGTLRFLRMIMINDSIMLISSRTYEARVHGSCPSSLRIFFCRQRKRRRVKGKTFLSRKHSVKLSYTGRVVSYFLDKNKLLILVDEREARGGHHAA